MMNWTLQQDVTPQKRQYRVEFCAINQENPMLNDLFETIFDDLGYNNHNMRRDRPYSGQPHTDSGIRGSSEIRGITFRDLRDCFIRAIILSTGAPNDRLRELYGEACKGENAALCTNDVYGIDMNDLDPMAISQNLACEIEKLMGIYPNA